MKAETASRFSPDDLVIDADVQGLEPELMAWKADFWLNANELNGGYPLGGLPTVTSFVGRVE